jgi:hypothetical protein
MLAQVQQPDEAAQQLVAKQWQHYQRQLSKTAVWDIMMRVSSPSRRASYICMCEGNAAQRRLHSRLALHCGSGWLLVGEEETKCKSSSRCALLHSSHQHSLPLVFGGSSAAGGVRFCGKGNGQWSSAQLRKAFPGSQCTLDVSKSAYM